MKKIVSLLLMLAMAATLLSGCGSGNAGGGSTEAPATQTLGQTQGQTQAPAPAASSEAPAQELSGTITMFCSSDGQLGFDAVMAEYQKINPKVNIEYIIWETVTDFETMMTNYIATGTMPDMYCAQVGVVEQQYAAEGYLVPLDDTGIEDLMVNGDTSLIKYDGKLYAIPTTASYSVTFANNAKLNELGITVDHSNYPKNMDEFVDLLQKCREAGCESPYGVAGSDTSSCTAWPFQYIYQVLYGDNPNYYADILSGKEHWSDEAFVNMFNVYDRLRDYMSPDMTAKTTDSLYADFISGDTIFFNQTAGTLNKLRGLDPELDILMLPPSFTVDASKQSLISGFDAGISITSGAKDVDLCKDFLKFVCQPENMTIFCNANNSVPTIKGAAPEMDPAYDLIMEIAGNGELPNSPILSRQWIGGFKELLKTGCQDWLCGADPQEVADKIEEDHARLMEASPEWVDQFLKDYIYQ